MLRRQNNDHNTFAREGTVHNPMYLDDEGDDIDPKSVTDLQANPPPNNLDDDLVPDPVKRKDDDFRNIFDDDYFKDGPVTLLAYAKKHEDEKENVPSDHSLGEEDDPFGPQYEPIKDQSTPSLALPNDGGVDPHYATIPRKQPAPSAAEDSDSDSDILMEPPPQYNADAPKPESPKPKPSNNSPPNLLRTGSVAKLVDAFTKGKVNKNDDEDDKDDDVKKGSPHAYKNPLYQEENNLMSYANPMYKDDENPSTPNKSSDEPIDEHQYLAPVDSPPSKKDHEDPPKKDNDSPTTKDHDFPSLPSTTNNIETPVPSPRPSKTSPPTNQNLDDTKDTKDEDNIKKPQSPPPPPPTSTKPRKKENPLPNDENTKKQPPAVAPKRISLKDKRPLPLDRVFSLQPNQKAPAPPPRVRSVRL